jgi:hypothetical protein
LDSKLAGSLDAKPYFNPKNRVFLPGLQGLVAKDFFMSAKQVNIVLNN